MHIIFEFDLFNNWKYILDYVKYQLKILSLKINDIITYNKN